MILGYMPRPLLVVNTVLALSLFPLVGLYLLVGANADPRWWDAYWWPLFLGCCGYWLAGTMFFSSCLFIALVRKVNNGQ